MSRNKHGGRAKPDTRDFGDKRRVQELLAQLEDSRSQGSSKKKEPEKVRGKPKSEKTKKSERVIEEQAKDKVDTPAQEVQPRKTQPQAEPKTESKAVPQKPDKPKTKLEAPTPKPTPQIKRAVADDTKLAYIITAGPILSQLHYAFDHAADDIDAEAVVFALEERLYRPKGKPKVERTSVLRMRVLDFSYDDSPEPKRWQHLVITGEADILSQHLSEVPYYPDGTPFILGAKIKLFYNLEARCGAIIKLATTNDYLSPYLPEGMGYVAPENF